MSRYYRSILNVQGGAIDPDAQAFLTAAGIVDATITSAINNLVIGLKGASLWAKMKAIYPFVGGTADSHKYNLIDPRDLDAAFRITFSGGLVHDANGVTPNGINGYGDTHLNPNVHIPINSYSHSSYINNIPIARQGVDIGVAGASWLTTLIVKWADSNTYIDINNQDGANIRLIAPAGSDTGYFLGTRIASNDLRGYLNGVQIGSTATGGSFAIPNANIFLFAYNGVTRYYSNNSSQFVHIGEGLTESEAISLSTTVNTFQTALSRNV